MARRQTIHARSATILVIANMIGAGVFTTSGFALADLRRPSFVLAAWLLGGLVAICGAISYGQLARTLSESGGEYLYLSRMVHPAAGFVAGWVSMLAGFTAAIAFSASTFEAYVVPPKIWPHWLPTHSVAIGLLLTSGFLHGIQVRLGVLGQNLLVGVKLLLLAIFVFMAIFANASLGGSIPIAAATAPFVLSKFALTLVWISLAYSGFNAAIYVAEEIKDATTTIPKSLFWGTVLVTGVYLILNGIFLFAVPWEAVVGQADIAAVTAEHLGGSRLSILVRTAVALALASSVSSMLQAGPRVIAKMAEDGFLPDWLCHSKDAPTSAIIFQLLLAVMVVYVASLQQLLSYLGFTLSISAACTASTLFLPAQRDRLRRQPQLFMALTFYVFATLSIAAAAAWNSPGQIVAALVTILTGFVTFALLDKRRKKSTAPPAH